MITTVQRNRNKQEINKQCLVQNITLLSHHTLPLPTSTSYRSFRQTRQLTDKTFLSVIFKKSYLPDSTRIRFVSETTLKFICSVAVQQAINLDLHTTSPPPNIHLSKVHTIIIGDVYYCIVFMSYQS